MSKKVLLVDDSSTIREQVSNVLASYNDLIILEAENGVEALNVLDQNPDVKLMLLDVNMPEMDGITVLRRLSMNDKYSSVAIVMLTTEASVDLKNIAKENGARAWLLKPFSEVKIQKVVEKLL